MICVISSWYRAAGGLSGYRVPPPTPYHHPAGEGLRPRAQCGQVSQTDEAKVHGFQTTDTTLS